jgi:hypothetical protein
MAGEGIAVSIAGERVNQLWLEATPETIEAAWAEAVRLAPRLEENERDYLEGLANIRESLRAQQTAPPVD